MPINWGSIPKAKMKHPVKDGITRINGRQVDLLIVLGNEAGMSGNRLIEFIDLEVRPQVNGKRVSINALEDVPDGAPMQEVVRALKEGKRRQ